MVYTVVMEDLGMAIRKRRLELGLKVYELANKVKVNPVYITQIEKHNSPPSIRIFRAIEKVLKLDEKLRKTYIFLKYPNFYPLVPVDTVKNKTAATLPPPGIDYCKLVLENSLRNGTARDSKTLCKLLFTALKPSNIPKEASIKKIERLLAPLQKNWDGIIKELAQYKPKEK